MCRVGISEVSSIGIGFHGTPTPPGMRIRTGRFERSRSRGELWKPQLVEVASRKSDVDGHNRVAPPAPAIGRHLIGHDLAKPSPPQFPIGDRAPYPVLEQIYQ
jgi:hypothetical protein